MSEPRAHLSYRPDIDGLRAIAVLLVVFFHLNPALCPGGFAGVDVFFVISGFLISGILLDSLRRERFSFLDFYARRARRIFPALAIVLVFSLVMGRYVLFANEFKSLGKHAVAGAAFFSNIVLFKETGYFDSKAELKPLLHLWSLGIEEQFYLIWPAVLLVAWRLGRVFSLMLAVAAGSFLANALLVAHHPDAAFYLPFSRFWELVAGALLAYGAGQVEKLRFREWAWLPGVLFIALSAALLNKDRSFPGFWALLPVAGAVLLIASGPRALFNRFVLSHRVAVGIGLISYPLYLWHWVLLYFIRIVGRGETEMKYQVGAVLLAAFLSWLTYRFVDHPIRIGGATKWQNPLALGSVLAVVLAALLGGLSWARTNPNNANRLLGYKDTFGPIVKEECGLDPASKGLAEWCWSDRRDPPRFAVWGDSHSSAFYLGLLAASRPGERWLLIGRPSCPPVAGVKGLISSEAHVEEPCENFNSASLAALERNKGLELVLLVFAHRSIFPHAQEAEFRSRVLEGLENTVRRLIASGKRVAFLLDNPAITSNPELCPDRPVSLNVAATPPACSMTRAAHEKTLEGDRALLRDLARRVPTILVFDPTDILCEKDSCSVLRNGQSLYSYSDHLSDLGSEAVARKFLEQVFVRGDSSVSR